MDEKWEWYRKAQDRLSELMDEYLDYYKHNKTEATNMLNLLLELNNMVEKKLK